MVGRRTALAAGVLCLTALLAAALLAGCTGSPDPSSAPPGQDGNTTAATTPSETRGPAPADSFPTAAFANLSRTAVDGETAALLQRTLREAAGGTGATATLMTADGTWTGATGSLDGVRRMRRNAQMAIGSITKTIIAAQVLQLVEAGSLALDDPAADHLPPRLAFDTNGATVGELLSMRSGIPDYVDGLYDGLSTETRHVWTAREMLALVPPGRSPAGSALAYSSTNYLLLGLVLEHVTGRPVARTLRDGVLDGTGLERLVYQPAERPSGPLATPGGAPALSTRQGGGYLPSLAGATAAGPAGGMASDSLTLARWWSRLCRAQVVSQASLDTMTDFERTPEYGLGVWDQSTDDSAVGNGGVHVGFSSFAECLPEQGAVVVVLINDEKADPGAVAYDLTGAISAR